MLQNTRKRIPQQNQKKQKTSLIVDLGEGPLDKTKKNNKTKNQKKQKNHLMGDPPILIVLFFFLYF